MSETTFARHRAEHCELQIWEAVCVSKPSMSERVLMTALIMPTEARVNGIRVSNVFAKRDDMEGFKSLGLYNRFLAEGIAKNEIITRLRPFHRGKDIKGLVWIPERQRYELCWSNPNPEPPCDTEPEAEQ